MGTSQDQTRLQICSIVSAPTITSNTSLHTILICTLTSHAYADCTHLNCDTIIAQNTMFYAYTCTNGVWAHPTPTRPACPYPRPHTYTYKIPYPHTCTCVLVVVNPISATAKVRLSTKPGQDMHIPQVRVGLSKHTQSCRRIPNCIIHTHYRHTQAE